MHVKATVVGLAAVLVLIGAGCGGKKTAAPATTAGSSGSSTTSSSGSSSSSSSSTTTSSSSSSSSSPSFASAKNCAQLASMASKVSQSLAATTGQGGKLDLSKEADLLKALASAAPSEIRGDFQTFADAYTKFAAALSKAGYTLGQTPTAAQIAALTEASKAFSSPKLKAAEAHLTAWGQKNCGFGTTTTP